MRKIILIIGTIVLSFASLAQANLEGLAISKGGGTVFFNNGIFKNESGVKKQGRHYLKDSWQYGNILLHTKEVIKNQPFKYDIQFNLFEFVVNEEKKYLDQRYVTSFEMIDLESGSKVLYKSADKFTYKGKKQKGFYKVIVEGDVSFYSKKEIEIREPNYVPSHGVGEKEPRAIVKEVFYAHKGGKDLTVIKTNKKAILAYFQDKKDKINSYLKKEKLNLKDENELAKVFKYYSSL